MENGVELIDLEAHVPPKRGVVFPLGQVELLRVVDAVELRRIVKLKSRQRFEPERFLVKSTRLFEVVDDERDVIDFLDGNHAAPPV